MWGFHEGMGWWMMFGSIWMVLFWVVVGLTVWSINRLSEGRRDRREYADSLVDIAKRRLAKGEITNEQFEELRDSLQTICGSPPGLETVGSWGT